MEKEKTYEQWEVEVKEKLADIDPRELLSMAEGAAIQLSFSLWAMRSCVETHFADNADSYKKDMQKRIAEAAILLDVLQLKFGDVAGEELEFLKRMDKATG